MDLNSYILTNMTWPEVKEALRTVRTAIIPIGAHEQHGPHMTENCDAILAEKMAGKLAERLFPYVLVTPVVNMGVSPHHLHFPGTISLKPETLIAIMRDMISSLKNHGIEQFLLLNAHGGNQATLSVAAASLTEELGVKIFYAKTTASAKKAMQKHISSSLFGHSCEREVSEALYLCPEIVRTNKLQKGEIQYGEMWEHLRPGKAVQGFYFYEEMTSSGNIGDGTKGSREIGEEIVEEALDHLTEELFVLLNINENAYIREN